MKIKFEDIQEAFDFVSSAAYGEHTAVLDKSTGQIYWYSELGNFEPIPETVLDSGEAVDIPHKNDLGLGRELVFDFVRRGEPGRLRDRPRHFQPTWCLLTIQGAVGIEGSVANLARFRKQGTEKWPSTMVRRQWS